MIFDFYRFVAKDFRKRENSVKNHFHDMGKIDIVIFLKTDSEFKPNFSIIQKYSSQSFWAISDAKTKSPPEKNTKSHPKLGLFRHPRNHE